MLRQLAAAAARSQQVGEEGCGWALAAAIECPPIARSRLAAQEGAPAAVAAWRVALNRVRGWRGRALARWGAALTPRRPAPTQAVGTSAVARAAEEQPPTAASAATAAAQPASPPPQQPRQGFEAVPGVAKFLGLTGRWLPSVTTSPLPPPRPAPPLHAPARSPPPPHVPRRHPFLGLLPSAGRPPAAGAAGPCFCGQPRAHAGAHSERASELVVVVVVLVGVVHIGGGGAHWRCTARRSCQPSRSLPLSSPARPALPPRRSRRWRMGQRASPSLEVCTGGWP